MTVTDAQLDALLEQLDTASRIPYPPMGLPIWGDTSKRDQLRLVILKWLIDNTAEAQR